MLLIHSNFKNLKTMPYWIVEEAVFILSNIKPVGFNLLRKALPPETDEATYTDIKNDLWALCEFTVRAIETGELKTIPSKVSSFLLEMVEPKQFVTWAHGRGLNIPDELRDLIKDNQETISGKGSKKTKKYFPKEALDFGIRVWPELQLLHDAMKSNTGFTQDPQSAKGRREDVFSFLEMHPDKCPIVSQYKDIVKEDLFITTNSHNWRIVAKILKELLKKNGIGSYDYQKIYKAVKDQI